MRAGRTSLSDQHCHVIFVTHNSDYKSLVHNPTRVFLRAGPMRAVRTSLSDQHSHWRRGKQLQQWNVAYSGDEENNCNSGTSLTVATRKTTATVNYSDLVRKGNKRNEHVQITTNVQGHSGH
ncbi:hypothetical protein J6590_084963 [Homalodisca vitripennis]|nr:hypothetical protein J6590_084963 [Homalodisca vitripennis]